MLCREYPIQKKRHGRREWSTIGRHCLPSVESRLCHDGRSLQAGVQSAMVSRANHQNNRGEEEKGERQLTSNLLRTVPSQTSNNSVLLPNSTIGNALTQILGLRRFYFSLPSGMFFTARLLQVGATGQVTDSLKDGALGGVELASRLPTKTGQSECSVTADRSRKAAYLGTEEVSEDMMNKDWS